MAALFKERARKPIIPAGIGIATPTIKRIGAELFYVAEIREPWSEGGYQIFQLLLTEQEMLRAVSEWTATLARSQP